LSALPSYQAGDILGSHHVEANHVEANHVEPNHVEANQREIDRREIDRRIYLSIGHGGRHGIGCAWTNQGNGSKPQDRVALGEEQAKQLLLLIDTDKKGVISKQEWMKFMEAEFDRLDKAKNGELDVKELTQSKLRVSHFASVGK
jgi:hypothetical protein